MVQTGNSAPHRSIDTSPQPLAISICTRWSVDAQPAQHLQRPLAKPIIDLLCFSFGLNKLIEGSWWNRDWHLVPLGSSEEHVKLVFPLSPKEQMGLEGKINQSIFAWVIFSILLYKTILHVFLCCCGIHRTKFSILLYKTILHVFPCCCGIHRTFFLQHDQLCGLTFPTVQNIRLIPRLCCYG